MDLKEQIQGYIPFNEQEEKDKEYFLKFIDTFEDVLTRDNIFGHFSSSAFVVNKKRDKMVVVYHNINDGWIYPGGHADGECDLLSVAIKEVEEETGLKATPLNSSIFAINANNVPPHKKNGEFISTHVHLDVVYILEADDTLPLTYRENESKGVKWIPFSMASDDSMVDFIRPVHKKLIDKLSYTNL